MPNWSHTWDSDHFSTIKSLIFQSKFEFESILVGSMRKREEHLILIRMDSKRLVQKKKIAWRKILFHWFFNKTQVNKSFALHSANVAWILMFAVFFRISFYGVWSEWRRAGSRYNSTHTHNIYPYKWYPLACIRLISKW